MPRRPRIDPAPASPAAPALPALDIRPDGIYRAAVVIRALELKSSSLRTEWRKGRLRIVRRCGRNYLIGRDLLAWLDGGEVPPPAAQRTTGKSVDGA